MVCHLENQGSNGDGRSQHGALSISLDIPGEEEGDGAVLKQQYQRLIVVGASPIVLLYVGACRMKDYPKQGVAGWPHKRTSTTGGYLHCTGFDSACNTSGER